ncbi:MAG: Phage shock protein (PspC) family protein, partial [Pseudonocardiales bacterium]|nr:Phage shock protein (PspC) family protein [Pseudonocardiales bacterium]
TAPETDSGDFLMPSHRLMDDDRAMTMTTRLGGPTRPLYRVTDPAVFGGVAAGICDHLGLRTRKARTLVRFGFIALSFGSGLGIVLYGAYWIVVPREPGSAPIRPMWQQYVIGALAAAVAVAVVWQTVPQRGFFVPVVLAGFGGALVWRQSSDFQRERWTRVSADSLRSTVGGRIGMIRLLAGSSMVVLGVIFVLVRGTSFDQVLSTLFVAVIVVVGIGLITGPIWVRMVADLSAERRALIRAQERADLAAHVHDSVLQTLALIQRNSASPREVARLARGQERELRELLYGRRTATGLFAAALHDVIAQIEDDYAITVDAVIVGDATMDADLEALVLAAREALVNAAKHAQVDTVSLYAEVEPHLLEVFVKDRGAGFDVDLVDGSRQGLRGSITARVQRHGGTVRVHSAPDEGTEIEMRMNRA